MTLKLHCQFNSIDLTQRTYRKEIPLKLWKFPGNEVGVKFDIPAKCNNDFLIEAIMPTSDEIQQLFQIVDILRINRKNPRIVLNIPYLPYARQDRVCNVGESFALKVFIKQLDTLCLNEINVVDLHSQVSRNCLEEMYSERLSLESEIYRSVCRFKDKTGLLPSSINLNIVTMEFICGPTYSVLNNVTVDVEL